MRHTSMTQAQAHCLNKGLHGKCSLRTLFKQQVIAIPGRSGEPALCEACGTETACWGDRLRAGYTNCLLRTERHAGDCLTGHQVARPPCQHSWVDPKCRSHRLVQGLPSFFASSSSTVRMLPVLKPLCSSSTLWRHRDSKPSLDTLLPGCSGCTPA